MCTRQDGNERSNLLSRGTDGSIWNWVLVFPGYKVGGIVFMSQMIIAHHNDDILDCSGSYLNVPRPLVGLVGNFFLHAGELLFEIGHLVLVQLG